MVTLLTRCPGLAGARDLPAAPRRAGRAGAARGAALAVPAARAPTPGPARPVQLLAEPAQAGRAARVTRRRAPPGRDQPARRRRAPGARAHRRLGGGVLPAPSWPSGSRRRSTLFTGGGPDLPDRHRDLRTLIRWSTEQLTAGEREVLTAVALLPGGADAALLADVCGRRVDADLRALVERHLVHDAGRASGRGEPWFDVLDPDPAPLHRRPRRRERRAAPAAGGDRRGAGEAAVATHRLLGHGRRHPPAHPARPAVRAHGRGAGRRRRRHRGGAGPRPGAVLDPHGAVRCRRPRADHGGGAGPHRCPGGPRAHRTGRAAPPPGRRSGRPRRPPRRRARPASGARPVARRPRRHRAGRAALFSANARVEAVALLEATADAVGHRRASTGSPRSRWAPRLAGARFNAGDVPGAEDALRQTHHASTTPSRCPFGSTPWRCGCSSGWGHLDEARAAADVWPARALLAQIEWPMIEAVRLRYWSAQHLLQGGHLAEAAAITADIVAEAEATGVAQSISSACTMRAAVLALSGEGRGGATARGPCRRGRAGGHQPGHRPVRRPGRVRARPSASTTPTCATWCERRCAGRCPRTPGSSASRAPGGSRPRCRSSGLSAAEESRRSTGADDRRGAAGRAGVAPRRAHVGPGARPRAVGPRAARCSTWSSSGLTDREIASSLHVGLRTVPFARGQRPAQERAATVAAS